MSIYIVNSAKEMADRLEFVVRDDQVLVSLLDGGVGIATRNERGYRPTHLRVPHKKYTQICDMVEEANSILFPERTLKEGAEIMISSMR